MVWCSNCTKLQPSQSVRSDLQCCNGCGKVVNQQTGSKCENELLNNQNAFLGVKSSMAKFKVSKYAKGAVNGNGSNSSESLSDIDDAEIGRCLLQEDEKFLKKIIWERMNEKYDKEAADRKAAAEIALKLKKEKKQKLAADGKETRNTAKSTNKRTSSRVNYDVLNVLLGESSTASEISKKSRSDSYTKDDAASSKNESMQNKFSDWGLTDDEYDEENNGKNQGDQYNDYEQQYYDYTDDG